MTANLDINGKESAKRKYGFKFLNLTYRMALLYFAGLIICNILEREWIEFPWELFTATGGIGGTLLGITIFEKPKQ